jgi:hypothetical protein
MRCNPFSLGLFEWTEPKGYKNAPIDFNKDIDPGIRRMVKVLNAKGLTTYMSCEGHKNRQTGYCHRAYVTIRPEAFEKYVETKADRLMAFLHEAKTVSLQIRYYGDRDSHKCNLQPAFEFPTHWTDEGVRAIPKEKEERKYWMRRWEEAAHNCL